MSYDLHMFEIVAGASPEETLERLEEEEGTASDATASDRNRRIADALRDVDPRYEESQLDYDVIAEMQDISVEEARTEIQLIAEGGLEINLYHRQAAINFPYWESLDADALTADIAKAAAIIGRETAWKLYDPQLGRVIDPHADAEDIKVMFGHGQAALQDVIAKEVSSSGSKPLWKRLFGRG